MNGKLKECISNNNGLYQAIFSNHNIKFNLQNDIAYTTEKVPPLYSNLVTRSKEWSPDDIFKNIDQNYEEENWSEWSVKDSFNILDLSIYGFDKLFDAQWIYLEGTDFKQLLNTNDLRYKIIETEKDLLSWRMAWDSDVTLGEKIFKTKLLNNRDIYFIAGYENKKLVTGCFINRTDDVLGISNFFAPDNSLLYWSDAVSFILNSIGNNNMVGYEREELIAGLARLGFEAIGKLSVWLKRK
jgi:hypothetical protein